MFLFQKDVEMDLAFGHLLKSRKAALGKTMETSTDPVTSRQVISSIEKHY